MSIVFDMAPFFVVFSVAGCTDPMRFRPLHLRWGVSGLLYGYFVVATKAARVYTVNKRKKEEVPLMAEVEKLRKVKQCIDNVDAVMTFAGNKE